MPIPFHPRAKTKKLSVSSTSWIEGIRVERGRGWILKGFDSKAFEGIMFEDEKLAMLF